jgi:hypothetical protein
MLIRSLFLVVAVSVSASAYSQSCPTGQVYDDCNHTSVGPGPCVPGCVAQEIAEPTGPAELCIRDECRPVTYSWFGTLVVAESQLANGYAVMGWSGPCLAASRGECPDIWNQAFQDLQINALRSHRAQGF